jgi:hypothetical protein
MWNYIPELLVSCEKFLDFQKCLLYIFIFVKHVQMHERIFINYQRQTLQNIWK